MHRMGQDFSNQYNNHKYSFAKFFKINENDIDMYKKLFNEYFG